MEQWSFVYAFTYFSLHKEAIFPIYLVRMSQLNLVIEYNLFFEQNFFLQNPWNIINKICIEAAHYL